LGFKSLREVAMEFTGLIISRSADDLPFKEFAAAASMSHSTAETTACTAHSRQRGGRASSLQDGLFTLGRKTECLIRNLRFDNVVLQSRHEDMTRLVVELEDELRSLDKMIESNDCVEQKENTDESQEHTQERFDDSAEEADSETKQPQSNNVPQHIKKDMVNKNIDFGDDSSRDGTGSLDLSTMTGATHHHNSEQDKHPIRKLFQWGSNRDRQRLSSSLGSTASESNSTTAASTSNRKRDRDNKKNSADEESISSHAQSVSSAPIFPWLGDPAPRRYSELDHHHRQTTNNNGNLFHRMLQRNSMNGNDNHSHVSIIEEEKATTTSFQSSNDNDSTNNNVSSSDSELLSTLDLKLRGCELAKSSLQELHTLQTRNLLDLELQYIHTRIDSESQSQQMSLQLNDLRKNFLYCQKEYKRKERLLREAMGKAKKANDREELLLEEVDRVRTELFALSGELGE
jgi:hypothetical protein